MTSYGDISHVSVRPVPSLFASPASFLASSTFFRSPPVLRSSPASSPVRAFPLLSSPYPPYMCMCNSPAPHAVGPVRRAVRRGRGGPHRRDLAVHPLARVRDWDPEVRRAVLTSAVPSLVRVLTVVVSVSPLTSVITLSRLLVPARARTGAGVMQHGLGDPRAHDVQREHGFVDQVRPYITHLYVLITDLTQTHTVWLLSVRSSRCVLPARRGETRVDK